MSSWLLHLQHILYFTTFRSVEGLWEWFVVHLSVGGVSQRLNQRASQLARQFHDIINLPWWGDNHGFSCCRCCCWILLLFLQAVLLDWVNDWVSPAQKLLLAWQPMLISTIYLLKTTKWWHNLNIKINPFSCQVNRTAGKLINTWKIKLKKFSKHNKTMSGQCEHYHGQEKSHIQFWWSHSTVLSELQLYLQRDFESSPTTDEIDVLRIWSLSHCLL